MIEIKGLNKSYHKNQVLKNVNFSLKEGEIISIIGPSGGGKSTFLRSLNYLEKADSGTMSFFNNNYDMKNIKKSEILTLRQNSSMVFQGFNLFNNKTALENIIEPLIIKKSEKKKEILEKGKELIQKIGLEGKENLYPYQLSGGQKQRIGIARAIITSPKYILFDEPTSALDPKLSKEILNIIKDLSQENIAMIIVTHHINFATEISNKIGFMENGVLQVIDNDEQKIKNNNKIQNFIYDSII